jgi:hypothetical protein
VGVKVLPKLVVVAVLLVCAGLPTLTVCKPPQAADAGSPEAKATEAKDSAEAALKARRFGHFNEKEPVLFGSGYFEDNESCFVCHADFRKEEISAVHLENDVTCADCHGDSEVHSSDEFNIIRPDVLWGRTESVYFCRQCHPANEHPNGKEFKEFFAKWQGKRRPNGRWVLKDSVCMDCHGKHAIHQGGEGDFKQ